MTSRESGSSASPEGIPSMSGPSLGGGPSVQTNPSIIQRAGQSFIIVELPLIHTFFCPTSSDLNFVKYIFIVIFVCSFCAASGAAIRRLRRRSQ